LGGLFPEHLPADCDVFMEEHIMSNITPDKCSVFSCFATKLPAGLFKLLLVLAVTLPALPVSAEKRELRPPLFKDIKPGIATTADVVKLLGKPAGDTDRDGRRIMQYAVKPFPVVYIDIRDDKVASIVLQLAEPAPVAALARDLGLTETPPATVRDNSGIPLGIVYPERGVTFSFVHGEKDTTVAHIILEPLHAEPFLIRAEFHQTNQLKNQLDDLEQAAKFTSTDARIFALRARILMQAGQYKKALDSISTATQMDARDPYNQLLHAQLRYISGDVATAKEQTQLIAADSNAPAEVRARAECQLGDFLATAGESKYKLAMNHHRRAIELAGPLADTKNLFARRAAKSVLADAHLAVARDIGLGHWREKSSSAERWRSVGEAIVNNMIRTEDVSLFARVKANRKSLESFAGMEGAVAPDEFAEAIIRDGSELLQTNNDPLFASAIHWEMGVALFHAAQIQRQRGKTIKVHSYFTDSIMHLEKAAKTREPSPQENYLFGQLYFLGGSMHAIEKGDHVTAVAWYDKSRTFFEKSMRVNEGESALHGERYVSMGVSYWETGAHKQAVEMTRQGAALLQAAVTQGAVHKKALAIPFGNLSNMNGKLGLEDEAKRFAKQAEYLERLQR